MTWRGEELLVAGVVAGRVPAWCWGGASWAVAGLRGQEGKEGQELLGLMGLCCRAW